MPYSNFKSIDDLVKKFGIAIQSGVSLFRQTPEMPVSLELVNMLEDNVPLALNINTEKARSELIIAPILVEVWRALHHTVSLFSGIDFTVDESRDLAGFCDFLFSYSPDQAFLQIPVICIVEAKNENIKTGYAQCIAEMLAAQMFNARKGHPVSRILGCVTTGSNWKFLTLADRTVCIDFDEYLISQMRKIVGIFVETLQHLALA